MPARSQASAGEAGRGRESPSDLGWILLIYVCSGICSLIDEVVWMRLIKLTLGNTVYASTIVVSTFMGGLALGALVMSPGTATERLLDGIKRLPQHARQSYILVCGAGEYEGNVRNTRRADRLARRLRSRHKLLLIRNQNSHSFPDAYWSSLDGWIGFMLGGLWKR